ncbi:MAG: ribonuclease III domain-containing protein [Candidatus Izemoplasmatales bacterium]|nr:ribonuclease III domain-containing protein [Candidatus Izemoplasmatales bacterium]
MNQLAGLTLAYLGDVTYESAVRERLIGRGLTKVNDLHRAAIRYTSAVGQAKVAKVLCGSFLSEDEIAVFKRGSNASSGRKPKNTDFETYRHATGLEALIGFLRIEKAEIRLEEVLQECFQIIEEDED